MCDETDEFQECYHLPPLEKHATSFPSSSVAKTFLSERHTGIAVSAMITMNWVYCRATLRRVSCTRQSSCSKWSLLLSIQRSTWQKASRLQLAWLGVFCSVPMSICKVVLYVYEEP